MYCNQPSHQLGSYEGHGFVDGPPGDGGGSQHAAALPEALQEAAVVAVPAAAHAGAAPKQTVSQLARCILG
jgi:hypothetical protein